MSSNPIFHYLLNREPGLERTNPVHVIRGLFRALKPQFAARPKQTALEVSLLLEELGQDGLRLPRHYLDELRDCGCLKGDPPAAELPRVVGLTVSTRDPATGFVVPLHLERSFEGPDIDRRLPFTHDDLLDTFTGLVQARELRCTFPERLSFRGENPTGAGAGGNSMNIAALLAALDALTDRRHPLCGACAVVAPGPGGTFTGVGHTEAKLEAFRREYGRGALLVCRPDCVEAQRFRPLFKWVWEVTDYADLARHLDKEELLEPVLRETEVSVAEWRVLRDRLDWANNKAYRHFYAVDLGRRLLDCAPSGSLPPALRDGVVQQLVAAHRHLGEYQEAERRGRELYEGVQARREGASLDEEADAAVEYVASFYDAHQFRRIIEELMPWRARMLAKPRHFRFLTRVKVFNTVGRAQVILKEDGWEDNFRRSLALQRDLDPESVYWTTSFLVHGLLRDRRPEDALSELVALGRLDDVPNIWSQGALKAHWAEAERQLQRHWTDPRMEDWGPEPRPPDHVFALYHQAVARQPNCENAAERLHWAADLCRAGLGRYRANVSFLFALCLELAAAAVENEGAAWDRARAEIVAYLKGEPVIAAHYEREVGALPALPTWPAAEKLLERVPYV
jgi:hypothetical protein